MYKFKTIPQYLWILFAIIAIGIFPRVYQFHDYLRFNADQGRDAILVSAVVENKTAWPLLGPKAGGTEFRLGPAFYYFEIISAKIFGNYPDIMAYPDLLTSILCIPLLFFFLHKYFDIKISLAMTVLFAISLYAITYSRFAWNPNSTPFWSILTLYALHEVIAKKVNKKIFWAVIAGIAIGIGAQLHTTLLLFLPLTTIILFGFLTIKKIPVTKYFFVIVSIAILLNIPQLLNEYQTGGKNKQAFFGGIKTKQEKNSFLEKIFRDTSCLTQGNIDILTGYEISDKCVLNTNNTANLSVFVFGLVFLLGGIAIGLKYFRQEKDFNKKIFLTLIFVYMVVAYIIFISLAYEISMRFYLILIFMPFLLLGFWLRFIREKLSKHLARDLMIFIILIFAGSNIYAVVKYFNAYVKYETGQVDGGQINYVMLGEMEGVAKYIIANANGARNVYITGNQQYLFKAIKPIEYLTEKSNIKTLPLRKKDEKQFPLFILDSLKSASDKASLFGRFSIEVKNN